MMKCLFTKLGSVCFGVCLTAISVFAETTKILAETDVERLQVLLAPTISDYGPFEFINPPKMTIGRKIEQLIENKGITIISKAANLEREHKLLPIRLPLLDSLLGYRVCLIRKGSQTKFDNIHSLEDWKASGVVIGSGTHWGDTPILEANGLNVSKALNRASLAKMLKAERFDCFHRGIHQIEKDFTKDDSKGLVVEKRILLVYPYRSLFFVSRKNPALAERIKVGYERAIQDGTWQAFLETYYAKRAKLGETLNLKKRVIIYLDNPFMTEESKQIPPLLPFIKELQKTITLQRGS